MTATLFAVCVAGTTCAAAAAGGGSPGVDSGTLGIAAPGGNVRYFALPTGRRTIVQAVRTRGGRILRWRSIPGSWGIPLVGIDGSTGGLSRDGRSLVLQGNRPNISQFAVLDTRNLRARQTVTLRGSFSFDALSPDTRTLYLIQYVSTPNANSVRYYVRAYDLVQQRLLKKIIFDRREKWSLMSGTAVTRLTTAAGRWAYTLYTRPGGKPFVHALDTVARKAVCIDLPWRGSQAPIADMRLTLSGRSLLVYPRRLRTAPIARIDVRSFRVIA